MTSNISGPFEPSRDPRPSNENPNFIQDYFRSSRLHFIGSFRARYESMLVAVGKRLSVNPSVLLQNSSEVGKSAVKCRPAERVIVHIDMDAFFASVAERNNPELVGLPIAVCHGGGEISSCSYSARKFGVRAGMFVRDARKLCPSLRLVSYDFPSYETVSIQIYSRFFAMPGVCVEAVSVDEAYLDLTLAVSNAHNSHAIAVDDLVRELRSSIFKDTGCTASAGIGPSKLLARLATKTAKPNGQFRVLQDGILDYLNTLSVSDLPGVGWRTMRRMKEMRISTVPELRALSVATLKNEFGAKQGTVFHDLCRGLDSRLVEPLRPRKSIGAEASWGIRFLENEDDKLQKFFFDMIDVVANRVTAAGAYGTKFILKIYRRIPNSDMSGYKHLGHGPCTIVTRSAKIPKRLAGNALTSVLREVCWGVYRGLKFGNDELRGLGLQIADLTFADLNFDQNVAPVAGTRRIDSFFVAADEGVHRKRAISSSSLKGSGISVQREDGDDISIAERKQFPQPDVNSTAADVNESYHEAAGLEVKPSDGRDQTQEAGQARTRAHSSLSQEEDLEIQPADSAQVQAANDPHRGTSSPRQASVEDSAEINEAEIENHDEVEVPSSIPSGWDAEVFAALPAEIRAELLREANIQLRGTSLTTKPRVSTINARGAGMFARRGRRGLAVPERKLKRQRGKGEQVTMTQFADISALKKEGHDMLGADEFRERPLREVVELLHDLRGGAPSTRAGCRGGVSGNGELHVRNGLSSAHVLDIPSPPSLSSDSEENVDGGVEQVVVDEAKGEGVVYVDEPIWMEATHLRAWMKATASDVRTAHVELLRSRVAELVQTERFARALEELRLVRRFAETVQGGWPKGFDKVLHDIQGHTYGRRGFKLNVSPLTTNEAAGGVGNPGGVTPAFPKVHRKSGGALNGSPELSGGMPKPFKPELDTKEESPHRLKPMALWSTSNVP